jgi:hypothetical protein
VFGPRPVVASPGSQGWERVDAFRARLGLRALLAGFTFAGDFVPHAFDAVSDFVPECFGGFYRAFGFFGVGEGKQIPGGQEEASPIDSTTTHAALPAS